MFSGFYEDGDEEVCMNCEMTEQEYNEKNGYPSNQLTLHYIGGETYCLTCRDPENSDDEDDEDDEDEDDEDEDDEDDEDEDDEGKFPFTCCGKIGAYDADNECSDCIIRPYKNKSLIEKVFAPQDIQELAELMCIAEESRWIDVRPYSHNIVGLTLRILHSKHEYDNAKINLVIKTFGLDEKGWSEYDEDE